MWSVILTILISSNIKKKNTYYKMRTRIDWIIIKNNYSTFITFQICNSVVVKWALNII